MYLILANIALFYFVFTSSSHIITVGVGAIIYVVSVQYNKNTLISEEIFCYMLITKLLKESLPPAPHYVFASIHMTSHSYYAGEDN